MENTNTPPIPVQEPNLTPVLDTSQTPQQEVPLNPKPEKKFRFLKGLIIALVSIVLIVGSIVAMTAFKTKTFTNNVPGTPAFTFKYPSEFRITPAGDGSVGGIVKPKNIILFEFITANYSKNNFNATWSNLYNVTYEGTISSGQNYFISENPSENRINMAWIETNKVNTVLTVSIETDESLEDIKNILSTLKFSN